MEGPYTVREKGGENRLAEKLDSQDDFAILRLAEPLGDRAPLPLGSRWKADDEWSAYGFPRELAKQTGEKLT